jgi:hypothetical protein
MNKEPNQFIVYWISKYAGKRNYTNERYRANMKTFKDLEKAQAHVTELQRRVGSGELYQQRKVHHVSYVYKIA